MQKIQLFKNEMFGEIRTMTNERGETFFVGQGRGQGAEVQQYVKGYPAACGQEGQGHPPILGDCL